MNYHLYAILGSLVLACSAPVDLGSRSQNAGGSTSGVCNLNGNVVDCHSGTGGRASTLVTDPHPTGGQSSSTGEQASMAVCGNGVLEGSEQCDDGNVNSGDGCSSNCAAVESGWTCTVGKPCVAICGDGVVTSGEQCDLGSLNGTAGAHCTNQCSLTTSSPCGNGHTDANEVCDDGNTVSGDGCSADCKSLEAGFNCQQVMVLDVGFRLICSPVCGDGIVTATEECDLGTLNGTDSSVCAGDCTIHSLTCGNGIVEPGEQCDNGASNLGGYNQCTKSCKLGPHCGDGIVDAPYEICDMGSQNNNGGYGGCLPSCKPSGYCGDGILQSSAGEQCDDGNNLAGDGCAPNCKLDTSNAVCGDAVITGGEQCDDGNVNGGDGCSETCTVEAGYMCAVPGTPCLSTCGDGIMSTGEHCDLGSAKNTGEYGGCNPDCTLSGYCGDGIVNGDEECDDGTNNGKDLVGCSTACKGFVLPI